VSGAETAIAVEIGGSALRIGIVDQSGNVLRSARTDSSGLRDQSSASKVLLDEIQSFLGGASVRDHAGIGIAMAGLVDNEARSMVLASNLGWRDFHMGDEIEAMTGMRVVVDKDTNMSAIGELHAGAGLSAVASAEAGRGLDSFIYASLGTGVGGSVIRDRKLLRGIGNRGGEFGHVYAGGDLLCGCGRRGCLETIAGGAWITRRARESVGSKMLDLAGGDAEKITPIVIVQAAEQGDPEAREILADAARAVGIALVNAVRMIYPEAVILGGSVGSVREFIFEPIRVFVEEVSVLPGTNLPPVRVHPAGLGDSAALIGAGLAVFEGS